MDGKKQYRATLEINQGLQFGLIGKSYSRL